MSRFAIVNVTYKRCRGALTSATTDNGAQPIWEAHPETGGLPGYRT